MEDCRTAHPSFQLLLKDTTDDTSSGSSISRKEKLENSYDCSIIVWDEVSLTNRTSVEGLDRTVCSRVTFAKYDLFSREGHKLAKLILPHKNRTFG